MLAIHHLDNNIGNNNPSNLSLIDIEDNMKKIDYKRLYEQLTQSLLEWREKEIGNKGSECPFDALIVLSHQMSKLHRAIKNLNGNI